MSGAEAGGGENRGPDELAGLQNRVFERKSAAEQRGDGARERAACSVGVAGGDARRTPNPIAFARPDQRVLDPWPFGVASFGQIGDSAGGHRLTAAGNAFARWANRPGALIRVPGILMLVPGSASLRGVMNLVQQQDTALGESAALAVLNILLALVAGLLFGNLLLPTRRNL